MRVCVNLRTAITTNTHSKWLFVAFDETISLTMRNMDLKFSSQNFWMLNHSFSIEKCEWIRKPKSVNIRFFYECKARRREWMVLSGNFYWDNTNNPHVFCEKCEKSKSNPRKPNIIFWKNIDKNYIIHIDYNAISILS